VYRGYPAEKPTALSEVLIRQSSGPGDVVVDPFLGSGSVGVAAVRLGRDFRGTDICDEALAISEARLRAEGAVPEEAGETSVCMARSG
jgi:site-specific DNA-methyltransferase (adenine-specific)